MRTTCSLDDDVAAAVEQLRRQEGIGLSEAINHLIRIGLMSGAPRARYRHRTHPLGLTVDVTDIGSLLELLDDT